MPASLRRERYDAASTSTRLTSSDEHVRGRVRHEQERGEHRRRERRVGAQPVDPRQRAVEVPPVAQRLRLGPVDRDVREARGVPDKHQAQVDRRRDAEHQPCTPLTGHARTLEIAGFGCLHLRCRSVGPEDNSRRTSNCHWAVRAGSPAPSPRGTRPDRGLRLPRRRPSGRGCGRRPMSPRLRRHRRRRGSGLRPPHR